MDRAVYAVGFAWLMMFGVFDSDDATWKRYAIEMPTLADDPAFKMIGGWSWE